jgi:hypothetical protein
MVHSSSDLFNATVGANRLKLHIRRGMDNLTITVLKHPTESAGLNLTQVESGYRVDSFKQCAPPPPPAPSPSLIQELANQLHGTSHKQCEATQWLTFNDRTVLCNFFIAYKRDGGFYRSSVDSLKHGMLRKSLTRLIDAARYEGWNGRFWLHPAADNLLRAMLTRAEEVHAAAVSTFCRVRISESESAEVRYDPSTGVAYHFTQSGRRLYQWPKFKTKSERACSCRKPDWMRVAPKGLSEGVLTFMCLRSGVVLGNTFLTGAEGCKDAGSALYSYHPLQVEGLVLGSVICDTPCKPLNK